MGNQIVANTPVLTRVMATPVKATPAGDCNARPPPQGCPNDGEYQMTKYVGILTVVLAVIPPTALIGWCGICCCPCDAQEQYVAANGTHYTIHGTKTTNYGPCTPCYCWCPEFAQKRRDNGGECDCCGGGLTTPQILSG